MTPSTTTQWIIAILNFLAALIVGATKILTIPPDLIPWLTFAVFAINLALAIFFGVPAIRGLIARSRAKSKAK